MEVGHDIILKWWIFSLPIISALSSFIACLISYIIGVNDGTLQPLPFIPFISDTGNYKPSSSVFTLFLTISCFVTLLIVVVRYFQVAATKRCPLANKISLCCGFIFILGKIVVSSFQLSSNIVTHFTAAGLYFLGATIYSYTQTYISKNLFGEMNLKQIGKNIELNVYICRVIFCIALTLNLVIFGIFVSIPSLEMHNRNGTNVAQGTEWALAIFKILFLLTFLYEFWQVKFTFTIKFETFSRDHQSGDVVDDGINMTKYTRFHSSVKDGSVIKT